MKILFTSTHQTSFITQDLNLLRKHFVVEDITTRGVFALFTILTHIVQADVTYTWFASAYSSVIVFLARLLGRRSVIVVGGADVAKVPEMQYGIWLSPWKSLLVTFALRNAWKVLAVDVSLKKKAMELADYPGENIRCLPTGYDSDVWYPAGDKEPFILAVAKCDDLSRMRVKGIDVLVECARLMPANRFVVVGLTNQALDAARRNLPSNVELVPVLEQTQLLRYYQRAKVYCQPSYVEGFPNSVCEAMLCGCIPVGTDVGGIPTAIGNHGFLVPYGNVQKLAEAIHSALQSQGTLGQSARERIATEFTLKGREEALLAILHEAVN